MNNTATTRTPQEVEQLLKASWKIGSFQFIGTYDPQPDGVRAFFKNLKTIQGIPLSFPEGFGRSVTGQPAFAFVFPNNSFIKGREYKFTATVNNKANLLSENPLFVAYKDITFGYESRSGVNSHSSNCKHYVHHLEKDFATVQGAPKDALYGAIKRLASETNKKPETFIFELLQNADDYPDSKNGGQVDVSFKISEDYLILSHNGLPFQEKNVYALCSVAAGDKEKDVTKTGYKGMGFKSIFKHSNYVLVKSGGFQFRFDEQYHLAKGNKTFWQLIPIWTDIDSVDRQVSTEFNQNNNVSFYIRPTEGISRLKEYEEIFNRIFVDERVLLFLRSIRSLKFTGLDSQFEKQSSSADWCISNLKGSVIPVDIQDKVNRAIDRGDDRIPEKYRDINGTLISFATKVVTGKVTPTEDTRLYAYLPTDLNFGFPFLINGDFIPDGSRDKLFDDIDWNLFLFEEAGYQLLLWLKEIYTTKRDFGYLELIPNMDDLIEAERDNSKITFLKKFKEGFLRGLKEVAFIPSFTGKLEVLENIIVDRTGFIDLIGVPFFKSLTGFEENPIIWELDNNKIVKDLMTNYDIGRIFGIADLIGLITEGSLNEWLMIPANNIKFFQKLVKNQTTAEKFKTLNIFLNQDGELKTAQELYWSVEDDLRYIDWLEPQYLMPEIRQALETNEHFKACFKAFNFKEYVRTYIIPNGVNAAINAKLDDRNTSLKFYRFLFKSRVNIEDSFKTELKYFKCVGKKNIISSFNFTSIFFPNESIEEIAEKGWLPEDSFYIMSDDFIEAGDDAQEWKNFWQEKFDVKEYEPESFIGTIILNTAPANKAAIVKHIADKNHNLNFYRYIFTHQDVISANRKVLLKSFPVWSYEDFSVIDSFNNNNIYLPDAGLLDVYENEVVPPLYEIISNEFCESAIQAQDWRLFWQTHFDVQPYEAGSFINNIIFGDLRAVDVHQQKDSKNSIKFWSYLLDNEKFISNQKQLSNFHVLVKHEEGNTTWFDQISNCYLSDEYNENGIESLVKEFKPNDAVFISPAYLNVNTSQKWSKFFIKCEIKHDESGLILNDLLPILSGRTQETSVKDIRLLFKFSEIIEKNNQWQSLKNVSVLTKEGTYFKIQSCFIGDFYTGLSVVNDVLPSIYLYNQVSDVYLTSEDEREKWLTFWKRFVPLNNILDDRIRIIDFKVQLLLMLQDTEGYRAEHFEHFKDLSDLYQTVKDVEQDSKRGEIVELRTKLNGWKLKVKGNTTSVSPTWAGKPLVPTMCLPSAYNPTFDFESLGVTDLIIVPFVSEAYQSLPNAKDFIQYLGVHNSINYNLKVLENTKAAHHFWELTLNGIYHPIFIKAWINSELVCIPCGDVSKKPSEIYSLDIAEYVIDKSELPSVDLRSIDIEGKNVEEFLGFKSKLHIQSCLVFLKNQPKKTQFDQIVEWLKSYNPLPNLVESNTVIQDFRQNGKWFNSYDRWVDLNSLLYFDALPYEIRSLFNSNPHRIKFPQNTEGVDKQKICTWLGVDILTVDDFDINVADKRPDNDFINILNDRLELICFYVFGSNWAQETNEYRLKLREWSFFRCSEITQTYNKIDKGIPLSMSAFKIKVFEDKKEVCYVNSWNHRKTFLDVINAVGKILKFKEDLRDFFEDNRYDVVDMLEEKGLNVPEDWKRPKLSATNTFFTNRGFSTPNQAESSASHIPNNGTHTQRNQEAEEPKIYDPKIEQILRGLDGLNKNSQYSINRQTSGDALIWLEENGWNIENASAEFGILKDIAKDGYTYSIIVRSAKTGLLRLDQYNWNNLGLENYKLLVQTGGRLSDFILYDTQTELLNAPYNNQSVIVKQNTKQPTILTNMVEGLRDDDKATLYFITSEKGASIFNTLTGLKSQSNQESGSASDNDI
jgi:hypothetical protein